MEKDPEILVPLTSARTGFEAETIAQALNAHGVPAQVFGLSAQVMQWELGYHDAIKVMVRRGDLETAKDILKAIKADSVDIDWSEVDVGEAESSGSDHCVYCGYDLSALPAAVRCPECGSNARDIRDTRGEVHPPEMRRRFPVKTALLVTVILFILLALILVGGVQRTVPWP